MRFAIYLAIIVVLDSVAGLIIAWNIAAIADKNLAVACGTEFFLPYIGAVSAACFIHYKSLWRRLAVTTACAIGGVIGVSIVIILF